MKRALVLGGGGSKGAYEIGVWKALNELDMKFDIVTGTSIGALIGVLYVQQDYERAYDLWQHLVVDDVMVDGVNLEFDIELLMSQKGKYKTFVSSLLQHKGADISPFVMMIHRMFNADKFFASPIDYGCMCVNFSKLTPQPMQKKDLTRSNAEDFIIASASCFPAFPMKMIEEDLYIDGGYHDNVPIKLAVEMGAEEIVAVDLKSFGHNEVKEPMDNMMYIEPWVPLGSFLRFDTERIQRNMTLGYQDTMKKFKKYLGTIYTFPSQEESKLHLFEEHLDVYFEKIEHVLNKLEIQSIIGKLLNYQTSKGVQKLIDYEYKYVRLIENIAYIFAVEDLGVYHFDAFLKNLLSIVDQHAIVYKREHEDKLRLKDAVFQIKEERVIDSIAYIYHYLLHEDHNMLKTSATLAVMMKDTFLMAYALFSIKRNFMIMDEIENKNLNDV